MRRKVSEIKKSWYRPSGQGPLDETLESGTIGDRFEAVIDLQDQHGYELEGWNLTSASTDEMLTETIVAVFKERPT